MFWRVIHIAVSLSLLAQALRVMLTDYMPQDRDIAIIALVAGSMAVISRYVREDQ